MEILGQRHENVNGENDVDVVGRTQRRQHVSHRRVVERHRDIEHDERYDRRGRREVRYQRVTPYQVLFEGRNQQHPHDENADEVAVDLGADRRPVLRRDQHDRVHHPDDGVNDEENGQKAPLQPLHVRVVERLDAQVLALGLERRSIRAYANAIVELMNLRASDPIPTFCTLASRLSFSCLRRRFRRRSSVYPTAPTVAAPQCPFPTLISIKFYDCTK